MARREVGIIFDLDQTLSEYSVCIEKTLTPEERLTELKKRFTEQFYQPPLTYNFENNCRFSDDEKRTLIGLLSQHFMGCIGICTNSSATPEEIQTYLEKNFGGICQEFNLTVDSLFPQTLMQNGDNTQQDKTERLQKIQEQFKITDCTQVLFVDDNMRHTRRALDHNRPSFCFSLNCPSQQLFESINEFLVNPKDYLQKLKHSLPTARTVPMLLGSIPKVGKARQRLASTPALPAEHSSAGIFSLTRQTSAPPVVSATDELITSPTQ